MTTHHTDEKKPARGGLDDGRKRGLEASQRLHKIHPRNIHCSLGLQAGFLMSKTNISRVITLGCLLTGIQCLNHACAVPLGASAENFVSVCKGDMNSAFGGCDDGANLIVDFDPAVSVISEDAKPVSKDGSQQEGEDSNNHAIGVEPEKNFFNQHGILWALICFIAGVWNGGGFQSLRRKDENL